MTVYKYSSDWIHQLETSQHWQYYWCQQKLMYGRIEKSERILEVGVGSKFAHNYIKAKGYDIVSVDIDEGKNPDIVLNIVECDESQLQYDVILAFNVFEHIPYDEFIDVMRRCYRSNVRKLFVGLPINARVLLDLSIELPKLPELSVFIRLRKNRITTEAHFWELNYRQYTEKKLRADLRSVGYACRHSFRYKLRSHFYFERLPSGGRIS